MNEEFKQCGMCGKRWDTRSSFLLDGDIGLVGYSVHWKDLRLGLFMFNHNCGTTLGIKAEEFLDLYDGPTYEQRLTGSSACPGHCLYQDELGPCPAHCECAYVREILQVLAGWAKATTSKVEVGDRSGVTR